MAIFLTGSTGYIGGHIAVGLLESGSEPLNLLIRAKSASEAEERLWHAWQLHFDFPRFEQYLRSRIHLFQGDLVERRFGLADDEYQRLARSTDSVIHCAASLNRKSERSCLNVNLRGTLEVIQLAARARDETTAVDGVADEVDYRPRNGFRVLTAKGSKSRTLRVTTVRRWTWAVAAIIASSSRSSDRRCMSFAQARNTVASTGSML